MHKTFLFLLSFLTLISDMQAPRWGCCGCGFGYAADSDTEEEEEAPGMEEENVPTRRKRTTSEEEHLTRMVEMQGQLDDETRRLKEEEKIAAARSTTPEPITVPLITPEALGAALEAYEFSSSEHPSLSVDMLIGKDIPTKTVGGEEIWFSSFDGYTALTAPFNSRTERTKDIYILDTDYITLILRNDGACELFCEKLQHSIIIFLNVENALMEKFLSKVKDWSSPPRVGLTLYLSINLPTTYTPGTNMRFAVAYKYFAKAKQAYTGKIFDWNNTAPLSLVYCGRGFGDSEINVSIDNFNPRYFHKIEDFSQAGILNQLCIATKGLFLATEEDAPICTYGC